MCNLSLNKYEFQQEFGNDFDSYFSQELGQVAQYEEEEMLINNFNEVRITGDGSLFIRNIVSTFDKYYNKERKGYLYSKAI